MDAVLSALRRISEPDGSVDIVSSGRVLGLEIGVDEACLTLGIGKGQCHGAHGIAELAFEVLRCHLPDTDLYLTHAAPGGCAGGSTP